MLELERCFHPSHVIAELAATTKTTVIEELAGLAHGLGLVRDRTWFVGALVERENAMTTATGNGVAFLHTLGRHPEQVLRPFMILGRSRPGVAFDSLDGRPTQLFFVLGLHYQELHLPWLAKLSRMVVQPGAVATLLSAPDADAIYRTLVEAERRLG
jgi:mannitol/fructose-specific phosphotransferase system IIA component (Ntr-type)